MSERLFEKVVVWASAEDPVRAVIVEGSRARRDQTVDQFSDYDLNLYVTDIARYADDDTWIEQIGSVWAMEKETGPEGKPTRLVLFEGGYDIDFKLLPAAMLQKYALEQRLPGDYHRGYQVVLDKDGVAVQLPQPSYNAIAGSRPSEQEYLYAVNVFWFELYHLVKYLNREDLWCVKVRDACIKNRLLQMIEWHARATHGWDHDTWFVGKHMQSWVEPGVWQSLFDVFARFDKEDSWRAVCALMPMYRRLASETARHLGYHYPEGMDEAISGFLLDNSPY